MNDRMSEGQKKKDRAVNFTANEIDLLIRLIIMHASIIESKKTDATTWKEKEKEWEKVTEKFNSSSPHCPRSLKSLQTKYQSLKKDIKKKYASHKQQLYKTGGGKSPKTEFSPTEEKLLSILSVAVEGLPSRGDCDQISTPSEMIIAPCLSDVIDVENMEISFANTAPEVQLGDYDINPMPDPVLSNYDEGPEILTQTVFAEPSDSNWAKWNPSELKKPLSAKLQTPSKKRKLDNKNDAIEKVSHLSASKLELIELQKQSVKMDIEIKQKKADIELQILNMDLDIKKVEYEIKLKQLKDLNCN